MHLLVGNFGVGNLGDEALKDYFLEAFPDVEWRVISANPTEGQLARLPVGIRSFFSFKWLKTLKSYRQCKGIVFGGGSLFTETESTLACILWWLHTLPARVLGKEVHLAFQGVGPFTTPVGRWFSRLALQSATTISVRDSASFERVKILFKNKKVVQSYDPVIWLIEKEKVELRSDNVLIIIPRKNSSENFATAAQNAVESNTWDRIEIVLLEPQNSLECNFAKQLQQTITKASEIVSVENLSQLAKHVATCSKVVSERFHGALPAIMYGKDVEIISQSPGDKLDRLKYELPDLALVQQGKNALAPYIH